MAVDYRFKFPLVNGLHARPASRLEAITKRFRSKITLINESTCFRANVRSVLSMVSADVRYESPCCISVVGDDEQPAADAVRKFVRDELPHCDEALPEAKGHSSDVPLPRSLVAAGLKKCVPGKSLCGGIGRGRIVAIGARSLPTNLPQQPAGDPAEEWQKVRDAILAVDSALGAAINKASQPEEADVLKAHSAIVRDPALAEQIETSIKTEGKPAARAVVDACQGFAETLGNSTSAYLRERMIDVHDICMQLLEKIGVKTGPGAPVLSGPSICFAEQITPGQFLSLDRRHLKGLLLKDAGETSHVVILARSMNVPTLVGVSPSPKLLRSDDEVVLDGELGLLVTAITPGVDRYYEMETARIEGRRHRENSFRLLPGMTADGHPVEVGANIASAEESVLAFAEGAQGIGLFRTEMLFTGRDSAPSEDEQTRIYTAAVAAADGRPVIIRLLDIGGDKPAPYLNLPAEQNPFLGYRGARLYSEHAEIVKGQLRAILRGSASGKVKIMVPMVCCLEEVCEIRKMLVDARAGLAAEGFACDMPPLGAMIEIPSVAYIIPELCGELDFFSVGSNDLAQYFLAADRTNARVGQLYTWTHPAFLRLLKDIVDKVHARGKWVGLCGEMSNDPAAIPLMVGLGLDEISVSVPRVGGIKAVIGNHGLADCRELVDSVLRCGTRTEVQSLVDNFASGEKSAPLISPDLIFTSDATTREQAIKQLCDRLYLTGRAAKPHSVEAAVWAREDVYSTGFGHGFAVPHCKSDHLSASSVVIAKLASPVEWKSLDGNPVSVVIMLAIRTQDHAGQHLKILARLSRLVMRDEFRRQIQQESDPHRLASFLEQSLQV
jgi:fructose-specific PTS system IIA-like component